MMSLTFGLFTQVIGSGPLGPLVLINSFILAYDKTNAAFQFLSGEAFLKSSSIFVCVELTAKASHIFSTKNIGIFEILMFEILTKR